MGSSKTDSDHRGAGLAIDVQGLRKNYGQAPGSAGLNGIDLQVPPGTVHGLLGPNGAGKTTTVRILTTLLRKDAGTARVAGHDVSRDGRRVRERIGLVGQAAAVDDVLTGRQNLVLIGRLNHLSSATTARRAGELLERFSLTAAADKKVAEYSGGMRRRLDLAAALVVAPEVLFVDEPTTGLDPQGRREVWSAIRELLAGGTTVLLTTQYLEEADQLAHRISMLRDGIVVAEGTPDELKSTIGGDYLVVSVAEPGELANLQEIAGLFANGDLQIDAASLQVAIPVDDRTRALVGLSSALREASLEPIDISLRRPTLDEVFLHLTATGTADQKVRP